MSAESWALLFVWICLLGFAWRFRHSIQRVAIACYDECVDPYRRESRHYKESFTIRSHLESKTVAGFEASYDIDLLCRRVDDEAFKSTGMLESENQDALARGFDSRSQRIMRSNLWYFQYELRAEHDGSLSCRLPVRYFPKGAVDGAREVTEEELLRVFNKEAYVYCGCDVKIIRFESDVFNQESIERNYKMLTIAGREAILKDERYGKYQEELAIAALKRNLELLTESRQKYQAKSYSMETERSGRRLVIRWKLKPGVKSWYELLGFRKSGGFYPDQWDDRNNGTLVIHAHDDGQETLSLPEGEDSFYTFFLKPCGEENRGFVANYVCFLFGWGRRSPLRFQITAVGEAETSSVKEMIERAEKSDAGSRNEKIVRALEELGYSVELDRIMTQAGKAAIARIEGDPAYTAAEKKEKTERVQDIVKIVHEKYQE